MEVIKYLCPDNSIAYHVNVRSNGYLHWILISLIGPKQFALVAGTTSAFFQQSVAKILSTESLGTINTVLLNY